MTFGYIMLCSLIVPHTLRGLFPDRAQCDAEIAAVLRVVARVAAARPRPPDAPPFDVTCWCDEVRTPDLQP